MKIVTVTETQPSGGIHLFFHPKTELPDPGRSVVVRYRDHRRSWYNWGTSSEMLIAILKVKPSQWHTREELTRSKELVVDWAEASLMFFLTLNSTLLLVLMLSREASAICFADFIKGMSVLMFILLVLAGLNLGAPWWFYSCCFSCRSSHNLFYHHFI